MHSTEMVLFSYQVYVMFLAASYSQTHAEYGGIVRCVDCLCIFFISSMSFFSWGGMEPEDRLRQDELGDSEICDW